MAVRFRRIKIGLDGLTQARLALRAGQSGTTTSAYLRRLIARDISGPPDDVVGSFAPSARADASAADPLIQQILEITFVTGILLRALLSRAVGEHEAQQLEARALEKAADKMRSVLGTAQTTEEDGSESFEHLGSRR